MPNPTKNPTARLNSSSTELGFSNVVGVRAHADTSKGIVPMHLRPERRAGHEKEPAEREDHPVRSGCIRLRNPSLERGLELACVGLGERGKTGRSAVPFIQSTIALAAGSGW